MQMQLQDADGVGSEQQGVARGASGPPWWAIECKRKRRVEIPIEARRVDRHHGAVTSSKWQPGQFRRGVMEDPQGGWYAGTGIQLAEPLPGA